MKNLNNIIEERVKGLNEICFRKVKAGIFHKENLIKELNAESLEDVEFNLIPKIEEIFRSSL